MNRANIQKIPNKKGNLKKVNVRILLNQKDNIKIKNMTTLLNQKENMKKNRPEENTQLKRGYEKENKDGKNKT